jgi:hypothetical protein
MRSTTPVTNSGAGLRAGWDESWTGEGIFGKNLNYFDFIRDINVFKLK